jgi:TATA-box binding protein (TBP) (component of TFIID and TFIIIB)
MQINNIVITGRLQCSPEQIPWTRVMKTQPYMLLFKTDEYTIVAFRDSNKCRIMGKRIPQRLPYPIKLERIQTISASYDLHRHVNLNKLSNQLRPKVEFEPEIFPALRFLEYNPICVNLFYSGKITILGLKSEMQGHEIIKSILEVGPLF